MKNLKNNCDLCFTLYKGIDYSLRMSNTKQAKPTFVEITAKFFGITIEQAQSMFDKADARNRATHEKGMALKDSVAQGKFTKGGVWA
jgi:hypothetical protein